MKADNVIEKTVYFCKEHSPEILTGVAIVSGVGAVVTGVKAGTKAAEIHAKLEAEQNMIEDAAEKAVEIGVEYTDEDKKKDIIIHKTHCVVEYAKLYGLPIALSITSIVSMLCATKIMKGRYVAATASIATISSQFADYRSNVVETYGEDVDRQLMTGTAKKVTPKTITTEDGEELTYNTVKIDDKLKSQTIEFNKDTSIYYNEDFTYTLMTLRHKENWLNQKLQIEGKLYLNDVFEELGMEKKPYGQVIGWLYEPENDNYQNHVDLGLFVVEPTSKDDDNRIMLDFNTDGVILDKLL